MGTLIWFPMPWCAAEAGVELCAGMTTELLDVDCRGGDRVLPLGDASHGGLLTFRWGMPDDSVANGTSVLGGTYWRRPLRETGRHSLPRESGVSFSCSLNRYALRRC